MTQVDASDGGEAGTRAKSRPGKRQRRRWRIAGVVAGVIVLVLIIGLILTPAIAGSLAPGIVQNALKDSVNGHVTVSRVSLSWFGRQTIGPVTVQDQSGQTIANLTINADRGLWGLGRSALGLGPMNLGVVKVSGEATVVRRRDGKTNIENIVKPGGDPAPPPPKKPVQLPRGLSGTILVESLNVRFIDEAAEGSGPTQIDLRGVTGQAAISDGTVTVAASAPAFAVEKGSNPIPAGELKIDATITNLADAQGLLTPEVATIDAQIDAKDLSTRIAGVLTGIGDRLVAGVGETVRVSAKAKGGLKSGQADIVVTSKGINADVGLTAAGGFITQSRPGAISISSPVVAAIVPRDSLDRAGLAVETFPAIEVSISELKVPTPAAGKTMDLRSSAVVAEVRSTPIKGTLAIPDQKPQAMEVAAITATINASDPAAGATIKAGTSVTLDGASAGSVEVDLAASNLVTETGEPRPGIPPISGKVAITDLSTAAAQPLVESHGLDLPAGIGPKVDLTLTAKPAEGGRTDLDLKVKSAGVNGAAAAALTGTTITASGEFSLRSPRTLAGDAIAKTGLSVSEGGFAKTVIRSITCDTAKPLETLAADMDVVVGGLSVGPAESGAPPVALNQVHLTTRLKPGADPVLAVKSSGSHQGGEFFAEGEVTAVGIMVKDKSGTVRVDAARVRPVGAIKVNTLPSSLAALASKDSGAKLADLARAAVGPAVNITLIAAQASSSGSTITLTAESEHLRGGLAGTIDDSAISLSQCEFAAGMTPDSVATLIKLSGGQVESLPTLAGPAKFVLSASPVKVPLDNGKPKLDKAGDLTFKVGLEGNAQVSNISYTDADGQKHDVGSATLQDILFRGTVPLSALAPGAPARAAELALSGQVLDEAGSAIAQVDGSCKANFAGGRPVGELPATLALDIRQSSRLDELLGRPGLVSGAVGESLTLKADSHMTFAAAESTQSPLEKAAFTLAVTSPRIATTQPIKASAGADKFMVDSPLVLTWKPDAAWINQHALAPKASSSSQLEITGNPVITIRLTKLVMPLGKNDEPMKPGVFLADADFSTPEVGLRVANEKTAGSATSIKTLVGRVAAGRNPGVIGFHIQADDLGGGRGPEGAPALLLEGGIYNVADSSGKPTPEVAAVSMNGHAYHAPSSLLDALTSQGGMLAEALGPQVTVNIRTEGASEQSGNLIITSTSPRSEIQLRGSIGDGAFRTQGEPSITLNSITPELGQLLVQGLPLIGSFEKRPEDGPATVKARGLVVPIDGDLRKLNGEVDVNFGTARFEASRAFGALLRLTRQRDTTEVGRKLEPLAIKITSGVINYPRWRIPLGDFTVDTRGTIDLVNERMDVIAYIPFGALTDEVAGKLNTGLGAKIGGIIPLIEQATMVPVHIHGGFADPKSDVDLELFLKETGQSLLRPDRIIRDQLEKLRPKEEPKK